MLHKLLLALTCCCFIVLSAPAQVAITGEIRGVVTDPSGAALPGVQIICISPALMSPRTITSQSDGTYLVDHLPIGTYQIKFSADGFKTYVRSGVTLAAGFAATINAPLQVGGVTQSVEVSGAAPVVDVTGNETATNFDNSLLQNIPSGRDPWSTVAQAPGTTSSNFDVGGSQSFQQATMEVHGSTPGEQVYSFNGLRLNWPGSTGGFTSFYIDHDSLQEFQVVSDDAPAEVGVGGIYMNMVPKAGSNTMHGLAAIYYDSAATQATINEPTYKGQPISAGSPIIMSRDTTANLGGPLLKDKWWIFGSYRLYNVKESILSVLNPDGTPTTDPNHQSNITLRSDYQVTPNNRVNFVWWWNEQNRFFRRDTAYAFVTPEAAWRQIEPAYILQAQWTSQIHSVTFDTRFGYMHQIFPLGYQPQVAPTDFNRQDQTLSTETGAAPFDYVNPAHVWSFAESASWNKPNFFGQHNFKFGVDTSTNFNEYDYKVLGGINALYNNGIGTSVLAYNTPVNQKAIFHETAFYAQDKWTIGRRLTINIGARFDHFRTFSPQQTSPAATFPQLFPVRQFAQSPDYVSWNTIQPRIGVAFDLSGKGTSVLRASFDRFDLVQGTYLAETLNPNGFSSNSYRWIDANGDGIPQPSEWLSPANLISSAGGVFTRVDPHLKRPYSEEVNVGFEQQLFHDLRVGVNYYYRSNKQQYAEENVANLPGDYTPVTSLNGVPITNPLTGQPFTLYNLNPAKVGLSDFLITNIGSLDNNSYNAVEFTAEKRMTHKWQLLSGFTIQQKKGTYSRGLTDDFNNPNNNVDRNNSILDLDATYVFKLASIFQLPAGVQFATNYQHYTGYPLDPNFGPPSAIFQGLNQGPTSVIVETRGKTRLPSIDLLNLRFSRPISFRDRFTLEPIVDLFNVTNANTLTGAVSTVGPNYLSPTDQVLNPFIARFGLRFSF